MKTISFPRNADKIWAVIDSLGYRSDVVEVKFLDASKTENVRKLDNSVVATYKRIIGLFIMIEPDTLYGVEHIILEDLVDGTIDRPTYYSIPCSSVVNVQKINGRAKKATGDVGQPYLSGKTTKVAITTHGLGVEIVEPKKD